MAGTYVSEQGACLPSDVYGFSRNEISVDVWGWFVWLDVGVVVGLRVYWFVGIPSYWGEN